jgi:hypothetical protein
MTDFTWGKRLGPRESQLSIPKTINISFNRAIRVLFEYHEIGEIGGFPILDFSKRPKGLRSDRQWQHYLDALMSVLEIGKRNGWLRFHVNRRGHLVYWLFDIPQRSKESNTSEERKL